MSGSENQAKTLEKRINDYDVLECRLEGEELVKETRRMLDEKLVPLAFHEQEIQKCDGEIDEWKDLLIRVLEEATVYEEEKEGEIEKLKTDKNSFLKIIQKVWKEEGLGEPLENEIEWLLKQFLMEYKSLEGRVEAATTFLEKGLTEKQLSILGENSKSNWDIYNEVCETLHKGEHVFPILWVRVDYLVEKFLVEVFAEAKSHCGLRCNLACIHWDFWDGCKIKRGIGSGRAEEKPK